VIGALTIIIFALKSITIQTPARALLDINPFLGYRLINP
jgi:hypothetical protein